VSSSDGVPPAKLFGKLSRRALDKQLILKTQVLELFPDSHGSWISGTFFLRIGLKNKVVPSFRFGFSGQVQVFSDRIGFSGSDRLFSQDRIWFSGSDKAVSKDKKKMKLTDIGFRRKFDWILDKGL
jgi:hypothetical protein